MSFYIQDACLNCLQLIDVICNVNTSGDTKLKNKIYIVDYSELKTYAKFQCGSLSSFKAITK
jgi:hypothetical protein